MKINDVKKFLGSIDGFDELDELDVKINPLGGRFLGDDTSDLPVKVLYAKEDGSVLFGLENKRGDSEFESISELLSECNDINDNLTISIDSSGIFIYKNKELRREISLKKEDLISKSMDIFIRKLIFEL